MWHWAREHGCPQLNIVETAERAASRGSLDILQSLATTSSEWSEELCARAAYSALQSNQLHVVQWLKGSGWDAQKLQELVSGSEPLSSFTRKWFEALTRVD